MRPGVSLGDLGGVLGYSGVFWGFQTDLLNLEQVIAFTKICYIS